MLESSPAELRVHCICGQKMKVTETMFGLPGKCIACRQKIRIPRPGELPPDTQEVFLKDHPEFLRKSRKKTPLPRLKLRKDQNKEAAPLIERSARPQVKASLDILDPLRTLCSLKHKLKRELEGRTPPENGGEPEMLQKYLDRVRAARNELDEQLRQRLMEVTIELSGTRERIVQAGLSLRLGEMEFAEFRGVVDQLRRRRDILERLKTNIKGWLSARDPHLAGGYANVSLDSVPTDKVRLSLPIERPDPRPLMEQHFEALRDALERRERAERRLAETKRVEAEGHMPTPVLEDCRRDCEAEKARADAEVAFRRARIEELKSDAVGDHQTIGAHLDVCRRRHSGAGMDKAKFAQLEQELLQAQRDAVKAQDWVTRALAAANAGDVPHPQGTFLERLSRAHRQLRTSLPAGVEAWIAWGTALVLGLSVFLPLVDGLSPLETFRVFSGEPLHWLMVAPILFGAAAALTQLFKSSSVRGLLLLGLWLLLLVGGVILAHEAQYGFNTIAIRFRQGQPFLLRLGTLALIFAGIGLFAASAITLIPDRKLRSILPVSVIAASTLIVAFVTNFGGYREARPSVTVKSIQRFVDNQLMYDTSVLVKNAGGRELFLNAPGARGRNIFAFAVERMERPDWVAAGDPYKVMSNGGGSEGWHGGAVRVKAKSSTLLQYRLPPGDYRVLLSSAADSDFFITNNFALAPPAPPPIKEYEPLPLPPRDPVQAEQPAGHTQDEASAPPVSQVNDVELKGIIVGANNAPRFSMMMHFPDHTSRTLDVRIGDMVQEPWRLTEYNSLRQTITLSDGEERILILERGRRIPLE